MIFYLIISNFFPNRQKLVNTIGENHREIGGTKPQPQTLGNNITNVVDQGDGTEALGAIV